MPVNPIKKSSVFTGLDTELLFILSEEQRRLLMALMQPAKWAARWRDDNGLRVELDDREVAVVDDLYRRLMEIEQLNDIRVGLEAIAAALASQDFTDDCCEGVVTGDDGLPADNDTTQYDETGDPPDGFTDWTEWTEAKCTDANWLADELIRTCRAISGMNSAVLATLTVAAVIGLITVFFPPAWLATATSIAIFSSSAQLLLIAASLGFGVFGDIADHWEANKQELVCACYEWTTAQQLLDNVTTAAYDAVIATGGTVENGNLVMDYFVKFWSGEVVNNHVASIGSNAPDDYVGPLTCDCAGHLYTYDFDDGSAQGWYEYYQYTPDDSMVVSDELSRSNPYSMKIHMPAESGVSRGINMRHDFDMPAVSGGTVSIYVRGVDMAAHKCRIRLYFGDSSAQSEDLSQYTNGAWHNHTLTVDAGNVGKTIVGVGIQVDCGSGWGQEATSYIDDIEIDMRP